MTTIRFLPWIGPNYRTGFAGRHILVLGELTASDKAAFWNSAAFSPDYWHQVIDLML